MNSRSSEAMACTGGESPECCQPTLTDEQWARRTWVILSVAESTDASWPRHCSHCGSRWVQSSIHLGCSAFWCLDCRAVFLTRD